MGEVTGFLKWKRETADAPARAGQAARLEGGVRAVRSRHPRTAGGTLHGLRHSVLQQRLPASATSFPTGTTSSTETTGRCDRAASCHQQLPEFTEAVPAPCEAACVLVINADPVTIKQGRSRSSIAPGARDGDAAAPRCARQARRGRRFRTRRSGRRHRSSRARATMSSCSSGTASVGSCATGFPSSRWRSATSSAGSRKWRLRARSSGERRSWAGHRHEVLRPRTTRSSWPPARRRRVISPCSEENSKAIHQAMEFLPWSNKVQEGDLPETPITAAGNGS